MDTTGRMVEKKLELGKSWAAALKLVSFELIVWFIFVAISLYYVIRHRDNSYFLVNIWLPLLIFSIVHVLAIGHYAFALTKSNALHIFIALFPVLLVLSLFKIGFFVYMIHTFVNIEGGLPPSTLVFVISMFSYTILDSSYIFFVQSSILLRLRKVTRVLSKLFRARLILIILMDILLVAWFINDLIVNGFNIIRLIFVMIYAVQAVLVAYYLKQTMSRVLDEDNLPEIPKVEQGVLVMELRGREEEGLVGAGAA